VINLYVAAGPFEKDPPNTAIEFETDGTIPLASISKTSTPGDNIDMFFLLFVLIRFWLSLIYWNKNS
jgi:hypothetical protein